MTVHFLQDTITHKATQRPDFARINRPQANRLNKVYNTTPYGSRKYGKKYSKVIGNPHLLHAGVGIIWNEV
ncbi:MAG: hypothetical protein GY914_00965 [Prochlorococcus sp.]|nr:hypothetical protein [Prochlorococcus sp.]